MLKEKFEIKTLCCTVCGADLEYKYFDDIKELVIEPCSYCIEKAEEVGSKTSYDEGHDSGYESGYESGYSEGEDHGYDRGYVEGIEEALKETGKIQNQ